MSKKNEEKVVDLFDEDEVITLSDDTGKEVDFYVIGCIEHKDKIYALVQPVELEEGFTEEDVIIMEVIDNGDGTDTFAAPESEEVMQEVFEAYLKEYADSETCGCDCEDGECDSECDCDCEDGDCEGDCDCGCTEKKSDKLVKKTDAKSSAKNETKSTAKKTKKKADKPAKKPAKK